MWLGSSSSRCVVPESDISFEFQVDNIQGETTCVFLYLFDHLNKAIFHEVLASDYFPSQKKKGLVFIEMICCKYIGHFRPTCISSIAMLIAVFAHVGFDPKSQHGGGDALLGREIYPSIHVCHTQVNIWDV